MKHAEGLKLGHHIPVPSYYQLNLENFFLMFAQGVGGAKTEVIKVGGVMLGHYLLIISFSSDFFLTSDEGGRLLYPIMPLCHYSQTKK